MADQGVPAGTYDVTNADGGAGSTTINPDGTYVDVDSKGVETRGVFARRDGLDCFDPDGEPAEVCWTVTAPGADGSFTATSPDGTTVTVRPRMAAAALQAPAPAPAAE
ncbi:hypothetical protein J4558_02735 [Leptolyngbya sp. 15MV]|nr:hypothetical protein J4558_02735 [Leptolyngbya sp. 15MV]